MGQVLRSCQVSREPRHWRALRIRASRSRVRQAPQVARYEAFVAKCACLKVSSQSASAFVPRALASHAGPPLDRGANCHDSRVEVRAKYRAAFSSMNRDDHVRS